MTLFVDVDFKTPLSEKYVCDVLVLAREQGGLKASDLMRVCTNYQVIKKTAQMMVSVGLLNCYTDRGSRLRVIYEVTPMGGKIADHFAIARDIFMGEQYVDGVIPPMEE